MLNVQVQALTSQAQSCIVDSLAGITSRAWDLAALIMQPPQPSTFVGSLGYSLALQEHVIVGASNTQRLCREISNTNTLYT